MPDTGRIERPGTTARGDIYIPQEIVIDRSERLRAIPGVSYRPFLPFFAFLSPPPGVHVQTWLRLCRHCPFKRRAPTHPSPPLFQLPSGVSLSFMISSSFVPPSLPTSRPPTSRRFFFRSFLFLSFSIRVRRFFVVVTSIFPCTPLGEFD